LKKQFASFISQHVREVAAKVGAPINTKLDCTPNIAIVFTTTPDTLLANIRKNQREYLGYYDNMGQLDALTAFTHPLQSWYTTETIDLHGQAVVDSGRGGGMSITVADIDNPGRFETMVMPSGYGRAVTGTRLGDGLHSGFFDVLVVAEPAKLLDYEIGTLADHIAMLALAQVKTQDSCQSLPSILDLLAKDCPNKPTALTANDLSYLAALYKMSPDRIVQVQRDEMAYQMQQSLLGK
jgi:hypothetical protein